MQPVVDHIHITVADLERAEFYYDRLLPLLGFSLQDKEHDADPAHEYIIVEYNSPSLSIGLVNPRPAFCSQPVNRRRPGALHHLAMRAESPKEVDALYNAVLAIPGSIILHPPQLYPSYCPDYYAFFFKDCEGIEWEIVHFDRPSYFVRENSVR